MYVRGVLMGVASTEEDTDDTLLSDWCEKRGSDTGENEDDVEVKGDVKASGDKLCKREAEGEDSGGGQAVDTSDDDSCRNLSKVFE